MTPGIVIPKTIPKTIPNNTKQYQKQHQNNTKNGESRINFNILKGRKPQ